MGGEAFPRGMTFPFVLQKVVAAWLPLAAAVAILPGSSGLG